MRKLLCFVGLAVILLISIAVFLIYRFRQSSEQSANQGKATTNRQAEITFTKEGNKVITALKETPVDVPVTRDQAVKISSALLGIDQPESYHARLGLATDNTVPCMIVVNHPAWEITYENLMVDLPGLPVPKVEFSTLICLLDAQTGALLKVTTPTPAMGYEPGELERHMVRAHGNFSPIEAAGLPKANIKPLIPLLGEIIKQNRNAVRPAKHLTAFLGLCTDPPTKLANSPQWIVQTGGFRRPYGDEFTTTDQSFWVNAITGKVGRQKTISYETASPDDKK